MSIKPQILAAISGAIAAYMADEEACQRRRRVWRPRPRVRRPTSGPWPGVPRPCSSGC